MVSQGSNRSLADILREKLIVTDDLDGDQSILDDHVSRIWTDKTPLRSPGDPSGRPRSPGYSRSRGHSSSLRPGHGMGPPPPRRNVGMRPGGGGHVYHQDLAYYDHGAGGGGAGVNERVREWMLDVERHQAEPDQRSHSSKTNSKTSPRSNRIKSSGHRSAFQPITVKQRLTLTNQNPVFHLEQPIRSLCFRSVSQERMMSTSWSAPMSSGYPQSSLDNVNKRLGASMMMPPPSQTNTLRKPASAAAPGELTIAGKIISQLKLKYFSKKQKVKIFNTVISQISIKYFSVK